MRRFGVLCLYVSNAGVFLARCMGDLRCSRGRCQQMGIGMGFTWLGLEFGQGLGLGFVRPGRLADLYTTRRASHRAFSPEATAFHGARPHSAGFVE